MIGFNSPGRGRTPLIVPMAAPMPHVMLLSLAFLSIGIAGCGPNAKQRYETALSILEKERAELDRLAPGDSAAGKRAADIVCQEFVGYTPANADVDAGSNFQARIEAVSTVVDRLDKPGTAEGKRFTELLEQQPERIAFVAQQDRVKRAEAAVKAAEKNL